MNWFRRYLDRRSNAGGKELAMAGETTPAAGGLSKEDVQAMINGAITPLVDKQTEITTTLGTIAESLKAKPAEVVETDKGKKAETVTIEQISQLIKSEIGSALTTASKTNETKAARDSYLGDKLKDLPKAYRDRLGTDATRWAAEEQAIREEYKNDLKEAGVQPKTLGNANAEGGVPAPKKVVDRDKASAKELISADD